MGIRPIRRAYWPLFWCLSPKAQANLIIWYTKTFGLLMEIPPHPYDKEINPDFEGYGAMTLAEIDRFMRRRPKPAGVK